MRSSDNGCLPMMHSGAPSTPKIRALGDRLRTGIQMTSYWR
jgi:hypothetical protein